MKAKRLEYLVSKLVPILGLVQDHEEMTGEIDPNFANHEALPFSLAKSFYFVFGISLILTLWTTYLIVLNIFIDIYVLF